MNGPGRHLFSRATLALNQHWMPAGCDVGDDAVELLHLRRAAHHPGISGIVLEVLAGHAVFESEPQVLSHALQQALELLNAERLAQIVVSAALHGRQNRIHGGMTGNHDHLGFPLLLFDLHQ